MNLLLITAGWMLCIPAILLGPIAKLLPIDTTRPWVDGLFINTLRAYKKYDTTSWMRRMISIYKMPVLTLQYLRLLGTRKKVVRYGVFNCPVSLFHGGHDVQVDHPHHRSRVDSLRKGDKVTSKYGAALAVGGVIHDGNHRLAACREAGVEFMTVELWEEV